MTAPTPACRGAEAFHKATGSQLPEDGYIPLLESTAYALPLTNGKTFKDRPGGRMHRLTAAWHVQLRGCAESTATRPCSQGSMEASCA